MKKIYKKFIILVLLASTLLVASPSPVHAVVGWGEALEAAFWKQSAEQMVKKIEETIVANLKIAAIRIINGRLQVLLTGSPGKYGGASSGIISNWQDFIFGSAQRYALAATNDFFTELRTGIPNTLQNRIITPAEKAVEQSICDVKPDAHLYVPNGDATKIFDLDNPWERWRRVSMPQNDLASITLCAESRKQTAYQEMAAQKSAQAQAYQGYEGQKASSKIAGKGTSGYTSHTYTLGTGEVYNFAPSSAADLENPQVDTPGSTIKALFEEGLQLPMKILENAKSIPEVVTSMVCSMITQLIQSGVTKVTEPIDQQIIKGRTQFFGTLNQMQSSVQSGLTSKSYFSQ